MKSDFLQLFSHRSDVKLNRKFVVFFICLVISFLSWIQINMSKEHIDNVLVKVDFIHLPKSRFGATQISDTLLIEVEADGYALMKYEMQEVSIEFKKLKRDANSGTYYFLPNTYTKTIAKQMDYNFKVIRSVADTIHITPRLRQ